MLSNAMRPALRRARKESSRVKPWLSLYGSMPQDLSVPAPSLLHLLRQRVSQQPDRPAVYYFETVWTWHDLFDRIRRLAASLRSLGVLPGDRVAVSLQNMPAFLVAQYAVWWCGGTVVPLNVMFQEKELLFHLSDSGASVAIVLASLASRYASVSSRTALRHIIVVDDRQDLSGPSPAYIPSPSNDRPSGALAYESLLNTAPDPEPAEITAEHVAYLNYTSGTTGVAKGAMNTQHNVLYTAGILTAGAQLGPEDVNIAFAPFFHITGSVAGAAAALYAKIPLVLMYRFDPLEALKAITRRRATFTVGAITTYLALINHPDLARYDLSSFQKAYSGGAPVSPAVVDAFEAATGQYIHNIYGLTESTNGMVLTPWGRRAPVDPESGALSVGVPGPGCDARIVDLSDPTRELAPGDSGELALKGPPMVPGYWQRPDETLRAFSDGWFFTGDVARLDADGWLYIVDRKKDMIVSSGYKVWPRDVEDVLYQHPAVRETAVVGVPDPYRGERVKAFVALKPDQTASADELVAFSRRHLAAYKVPREIVFVEEIPKTATGKFLRRVLRDGDSPR